MIYFIAPYSKQFLGASRKIELLLGLLNKIDNVVLVNSWVDSKNIAPFIELLVDEKPVHIRQYFLPAKSKNRLIYSLINYFNLKSIRDQLVNDLGKPNHIWLYNSYFLEANLATSLKKQYNSKLILELEDSCFSRSRGINPKPYLDNFAWKKLIKKLDFAYAVNQTIAELIRCKNKPVSVLPGLISTELVKGTNKQENLPFANPNNRIKLGYFGGLCAEKGVQMLMDLFYILPNTFEFIITGTGEMEGDIKKIAQSFPERFRYYGRVSNEELIRYISETDVFLNPHQPMEDMSNGVFPFKVMEAVASKRMIVSTSLSGNTEFEETLKGIVFLDYNLNDWKNTLENARQIYKDKAQAIFKSSEEAIALYSEEAVVLKLKSFLNI